MQVKFNRLDNQNNMPALTDEQLAVIEKQVMSAPLKQGGSAGPISWDADFHIDFDNIINSYAYLKVYVFGYEVVNGRLDSKNPKIAVDATVLGNGVKGEAGIDFEKRVLYFKCTISFLFWSEYHYIPIINF